MNISEDYVLELQRRIAALEADLARSEAEADLLDADLCLAWDDANRSAETVEGYERLVREPWLLIAVTDIPTDDEADPVHVWVAGNTEVCISGLIPGVIVRCGIVDGFVSLPQAALSSLTAGAC